MLQYLWLHNFEAFHLGLPHHAKISYISGELMTYYSDKLICKKSLHIATN